MLTNTSQIPVKQSDEISPDLDIIHAIQSNPEYDNNTESENYDRQLCCGLPLHRLCCNNNADQIPVTQSDEINYKYTKQPKNDEEHEAMYCNFMITIASFFCGILCTESVLDVDAEAYEKQFRNNNPSNTFNDINIVESKNHMVTEEKPVQESYVPKCDSQPSNIVDKASILSHSGNVQQQCI